MWLFNKIKIILKLPVDHHFGLFWLNVTAVYAISVLMFSEKFFYIAFEFQNLSASAFQVPVAFL